MIDYGIAKVGMRARDTHEMTNKGSTREGDRKEGEAKWKEADTNSFNSLP